MQSAGPSVLAGALLGWIRRERRDFPWRRRRDPYAVWISEVMLQQTQASTVTPYFTRWMERFPDIHILAASPLDDVLKAWEGLGYYARARNIHRAAQTIVARYDGRIPADERALLAVPGIGRYTSGAILSLAFGQAVPVLDGNVRRVLCRTDNVTEDPKRPPVEQSLWARAISLVDSVPAGSAGDLNEALMELGAVICTPRRPDCPRCPLNHLCLAHALGVEEARPIVSARPRIPRYESAAGIITRPEDGRYLLVRRPYEGLLGGLWGFPSVQLSTEGSPGEQLVAAMKVQLGISVEVGDTIAAVRHIYTHFRVELAALPCQVFKGEPKTGYYPEIMWADDDCIRRLALAGIDKKIVKGIHTRSVEEEI